MAIRTRRMKADDVEECFALAARRAYFHHQYGNGEELCRLIGVSKSLLHRASANGGVVEDLNKPPGKRLLSAGFTVFVDPDWLHGYMSNPFPFPGGFVLRWVASGGDGLVLNHEQLRRANCSGEGLHAIVVAMGWDTGLLAREDSFDIRMAAIESFLVAHRGFRMTELVHEVMSGFEEAFCLGGNAWVERSRYPRRFANAGGFAEPILIGMTREEAQQPGYEAGAAAPLFIWRDFRFCFSPAQQQTLELVCEHLPDSEIAGRLGIGEDAVGRRLQRIYRRVAAYQDMNDPAFPPETKTADRRNLLIRYLGNHPHELRPHCAVATKRTRTQAT